MSGHLFSSSHASRFTLHVSRSSAGFTLLPVIGILAIMTIGLSMVAPNLVAVLNQEATDSESLHLQEIERGMDIYMRQNLDWPATLPTLSPDYLSLSDTALANNDYGYPRYYYVHPTVNGFSNAAGMNASDVEDARFLVISDLTQDASPTVSNSGQFETWWGTAETSDLRIQKGNMASLFHQVTLSSTGTGGSYQIDGTSISSSGGTLSDHTKHHLKGTVISLDEANTYGTPEIQFALTENVAFTYVPCLADGLRWTIPPAPSCSSITLWMSSIGNTSGAPGYRNWKDGQMVSFGDPNLTFTSGTAGVTSGTFTFQMDLEDFTSSTDIDAGHYVSKSITIGESGYTQIALNVGDLLLSVDASETLESTNTLAVADEDVFIFRPDTSGDYSSGTFIMLIDGSDIGLGEVEAITLVELNSIVAGRAIQAGTFLVSESGDYDIHHFRPTSVGATTSGQWQVFLDGSDMDVEVEWEGIELIEMATTLGDATLSSGQILGILKDDDDLGSNDWDVDSEDVFILDLTSTGDTTSGSASTLFEGGDVSLSTSNESLDVVTLTGNGLSSVVPLTVINPSFETGDLTGWSLTDDLLDAGATNQWGATTSSLKNSGPHGGAYYGNASVNGRVGAGFHRHGIYQRVDLSAYSTEIDTGNATVTINGYGHGEDGQDYSFLRIAFYDAASGGNQLGSNVDSGTATQTNTWTALSISGEAVPVGTRSIEIFGIAHKGVEGGTQENAGVDDISGTLTLQ